MKVKHIPATLKYRHLTYGEPASASLRPMGRIRKAIWLQAWSRRVRAHVWGKNPCPGFYTRQSRNHMRWCIWFGHWRGHASVRTAYAWSHWNLAR